jgi:hypothetical protein
MSDVDKMGVDIWDAIQVDASEFEGLTTQGGGELSDLIRNNALAHLREIGAADFIKNDISVSFGVTQDNSAKALRADLEDRGFEASSKTWVEPMTLKKLIRERVEANQEIDLEMFNAHVGQVAKIEGA